MWCSLLLESQPILERAALHHATATTRAACTEALAVSAFVATEDALDTFKLLDTLARLWTAGNQPGLYGYVIE